MTKPPKKSRRVLEFIPAVHQASKPSELIQIRGHGALSLTARRTITVLWHNAHRQGIKPGRTYEVALSKLTSPGHKGTELLVEAIEALMQTIVVVPLPDGTTDRTQVLGGNNMGDPNRQDGVLRYRFDEVLMRILAESGIWGKISMPELMALSSKYSISLYENVSQWVGLDVKTQEVFSLDDFRAMLGVEDGKYDLFGDLNRSVIRQAVSEINALAPFNVSIAPKKTGKKVTHVQLSWWPKSASEKEAAQAEIDRSRIGRRARIAGKAEQVIDDE